MWRRIAPSTVLATLGFSATNSSVSPGAGAGDVVDLVARVVGEALGERRLPGAALLDARERDALDAELLREVGQAVEHRARQLVAGPGHAQALHDAAARDHASNTRKPLVPARRR